MLRNIFRGFCSNTAGRGAVACAIGLLAGVQSLMSAGSAKKARMHVARTPAERRQRIDYFSIRRTRLDSDYVYWVLQGFGKYQCFVLLDTWREAMDEALRRLAERVAGVQQLVPVIAAGRA